MRGQFKNKKVKTRLPDFTKDPTKRGKLRRPLSPRELKQVTPVLPVFLISYSVRSKT